MRTRSSFWRRLVIIGIASLIVAVFGTQATFAQDAAEVVAPTAEDWMAIQVAVDSTWVLLAAFLVFFMQAGFAMLEGGLVSQRSVVNTLAVNFVDATITAVVFWLVGFGIAFGADNGSGLFGTTLFAIGTGEFGNLYYGNLPTLVFFVFQFAFAATAATITTGALGERTDFVGDQVKSIAIAALIYPVVVHWIWGGGWLAQAGFHDFAGSTVVHFVGAMCALVGIILMGPRPGRKFGSPPKPHNMGMAALGTMILWFGWYGFNTGSTLGIIGMADLAGLVALNTTLAAAVGTFSAMMIMKIRTNKWDLVYGLNGSLAGLVAITAGCAFVQPGAAIIIGILGAGIMIVATDLLEALKLDDAVGAFPVHGAAGIFGTLAIGLFADSSLTFNGEGGLLTGGGAALFGTQLLGVVAVGIWVAATSFVLFGALKAVGRLRVSHKADALGMDVYEHGASLWPDVLPLPDEDGKDAKGAGAMAPAVGD